MAKKPVKYYVVDAFTDSAFKGNPAAVCLLKDERDDEWLQNVATEFNLSQTCFLTRATTVTESDDSSQQPPRFHLRWFTPVAEVSPFSYLHIPSRSYVPNDVFYDKLLM
ncbi:hypothetical protein LIER_20287 [Lithospermum erythrorhizon]|uniref:Uncharacterized protein n=1 Tax=Lithospermum erythrorhizon TaxID=34254 RepID=A0AAV3QNZ3_LITER